MQLLNGQFRTMLLGVVRGAFKWDKPGVQAPQIQHVTDLGRQRTALLKDRALREAAECLVKRAREDVERLYGRVGLHLEEDQLMVEFLEQAGISQGPQLLINKGHQACSPMV